MTTVSLTCAQCGLKMVFNALNVKKDEYGVIIGINCDICGFPITQPNVELKKKRLDIMRTPDRGYHRSQKRRDFGMDDCKEWLESVFGPFIDGEMHICVNGSNLDLYLKENGKIDVFGGEWTFSMLYTLFACRFEIKGWGIK